MRTFFFLFGSFTQLFSGTFANEPSSPSCSACDAGTSTEVAREIEGGWLDGGAWAFQQKCIYQETNFGVSIFICRDKVDLLGARDAFLDLTAMLVPLSAPSVIEGSSRMKARDSRVAERVQLGR
jgi:hypothetical protein